MTILSDTNAGATPPALEIRELKESAIAVSDLLIGELARYSIGQGFEIGPCPVVLALIDRSGRIHGGLVGKTMHRWLHIELLAIAAPSRRQGHGRRLVEYAIGIALEQGCHGIWLDTVTYEAPGFYERLGFSCFGEIEDHPDGHSRRFYKKRLD